MNLNIRNFKRSLKGIQWEKKTVILFKKKAVLLLPHHENSGLDLRSAYILDHGWTASRASKKYPDRIPWSGTLIHPKGSPPETKYYPITLDLTDDGVSPRIVHSPPGRPGVNMTILIDRFGNLVPEVHYYPPSPIRVWLLSRSWEHFGWDLAFPVVAFQYLEGEYPKHYSIRSYLGNLRRNRG